MKYFAIIALTITAAAQTPAPRTQVSGIVSSVTAAEKQVALQTTKGETLALTVDERTSVLHATPGETDPKKWTKMPLAEISSGDEVLAYVRGALDQKPLIASTLVVRTKGDLASMAQKQLDDWKKRGTVGNVTAVDAGAKTITIKVGSKEWTLKPTDKTDFHRYSLDSNKPSDAKPSSLAEVKPGDQVNVLGEKNNESSTITAETIYAGTFRQLAATIVSIDPAANEMKVTDLATKKPLTIKISPESAMKKLPDQLATMLARRYGVAARSGGPGGGAPGGADGGPGRGGMRGGGPGGPGGGGFPGRGEGGGGGRGGDIGGMIDRLPPMQLSELKPKDAIMVSTTMGSDPSRVTAIMLLAGVEPILTAAPNATRDIMSGWNLGGGGGEGN